MTLKDLVQDGTSKRTRQEVPYEAIADMVGRAGDKAGSVTAAAMEMGYSGNVFANWQQKGLAPTTAVYILRGYMAEHSHPFDTVELAYLIVAVNSCKTLPNGMQRDLAARLAQEIKDVA